VWVICAWTASSKSNMGVSAGNKIAHGLPRFGKSAWHRHRHRLNFYL
jgi:hypothetical protein